MSAVPSNRSRRVAVAPMMECTDRHFRYLARLISRHTLLYTEMVTTGALLHGRGRELAYDPAEHPLALQLGGSAPEDLARCARRAAAAGFDEINLNVGCPSDRVRAGRFGACLMAEPHRVAACVGAMRAAVDLPVTVKTRIGIDDRDSYEALAEFVATVAQAGCETFIVHARKAWLRGLSPKENREVPPLRHDVVYRLKRDFPGLEIVLNGGLRALDEVVAALGYVDGVMIGRAAYEDPWLLAAVDRRLFGDPRPPVRRDAVLAGYLEYARDQHRLGVPLSVLRRPLLGLFRGMPGARRWRRALTCGVGPERTGFDGIRALAASLEGPGRGAGERCA